MLVAGRWQDKNGSSYTLEWDGLAAAMPDVISRVFTSGETPVPVQCEFLASLGPYLLPGYAEASPLIGLLDRPAPTPGTTPDHDTPMVPLGTAIAVNTAPFTLVQAVNTALLRNLPVGHGVLVDAGPPGTDLTEACEVAVRVMELACVYGCLSLLPAVCEVAWW